MSSRAEAFSAVRWTTFVTVSRVLLQTGQLVILARLISPHDFGVMAMILSVTAFIQLFADLGVSSTIIYARDITREILSTLYWLNVAVGAVLSAAVWAASPLAASFYNTPELEAPLALAGTSFLLLALGQQIKVLAEKRLAFRSIAIVEFASALLSTAVTIIIAFLGGGVYSLVAGVVVLASANTIFYWAFNRNGWLPTWHFRLREASEHLKSGLYLLGASLANTASLQADVIIVGRLLGGAALGFYTVPRELTLKVMFATNPIVTRVGTPLIAKAQGDRDILCRIYLATIRMTSAINFPIYGAIAAFRHEVVQIVFGAQWSQSANLLGIMAVWGMFRALGNPIGSLLYGTGKARLALAQSLGVTVCIVPTIIFGGHWGAVGVAVALTIFYIAFTFAAWIVIVRPITDAGIVEYTLQWVTPLLITGLSIAISVGATSRLDGDLLRLLVGLVMGGLSYLVLSWFFNRQWWDAMIGLAGLTRTRTA